jgi:hypothetical protein
MSRRELWGGVGKVVGVVWRIWYGLGDRAVVERLRAVGSCLLVGAGLRLRSCVVMENMGVARRLDGDLMSVVLSGVWY